MCTQGGDEAPPPPTGRVDAGTEIMMTGRSDADMDMMMDIRIDMDTDIPVRYCWYNSMYQLRIILSLGPSGEAYHQRQGGSPWHGRVSPMCSKRYS